MSANEKSKKNNAGLFYKTIFSTSILRQTFRKVHFNVILYWQELIVENLGLLPDTEIVQSSNHILIIYSSI